ncbi:MAG: hypothetical protein JWN44_1119 [Myxococcales bacterium]|nr:hypothetical protein [Myxococcales bacterium]
MSTTLRAALIVVALLSATPCLSQEIVDDYGLRIDLNAANTRHCVISPRELRVAGDCKGVGVDKLADKAEAAIKKATVPGVGVAAVVRWNLAQSTTAMMTIMAAPPSAPTHENLGDHLAGLYNGLHPNGPHVVSRVDPRLHYERLSVAGTPTLRCVFDAQAPSVGDVRAIVYVVFGAKHQYDFLFMTKAAHEAETRVFAEQLLATISLPALSADQQRQFGRSKSAP